MNLLRQVEKEANPFLQLERSPLFWNLNNMLLYWGGLFFLGGEQGLLAQADLERAL